MAHGNNQIQKPKISREFMARLNRLRPNQKIHAIVMLRAKENQPTAAPRRSRGERQAMIEAIRHEAEAALPEIDRILEEFQGKRLTDGVSALGSIQVEATIDGLVALASSEHVKAILEDQTISAIQ